MKKANILLRQADHEKEKNDNKNVTLLKPEWFVQDTTMSSPDLELVQRIKDNASHIDKSVKKALDAGNVDVDSQSDGGDQEREHQHEYEYKHQREPGDEHQEGDEHEHEHGAGDEIEGRDLDK